MEKNVSPELHFEAVPDDAKTLALIVDDPDAMGEPWVHWVIWNIPAKTNKLAMAQPDGYTKGGNSGGGLRYYEGPCPPSGTHRYFFKLFALDTDIEIAEGSRKPDLLKAMEGHIIAKAELVGKYKKRATA